MWYPGIGGAQALANILFGDVNSLRQAPRHLRQKRCSTCPIPSSPDSKASASATQPRAQAQALRPQVHRGRQGRLQVVRSDEQAAPLPLRLRPLLYHLRLLRPHRRRRRSAPSTSPSATPANRRNRDRSGLRRAAFRSRTKTTSASQPGSESSWPPANRRTSPSPSTRSTSPSSTPTRMPGSFSPATTPSPQAHPPATPR